MAGWKNLDTLNAYKTLKASDHRVDLREVLAEKKAQSASEAILSLWLADSNTTLPQSR